MKIALIYLGSNNLLSLTSVLKYLGVKFEIIEKTKKNLDDFSHIMLPGVGNFDYIINQLDINFKRDLLIKTIKKKPTLGICVGMQILGLSSTEGKRHGLGILKHKYTKLKQTNLLQNKVPNTGYRKVEHNNKMSIFKDIPPETFFYFNHSYGLKFNNFNSLNYAKTQHNFEFVSAFEIGNIFGTQFHPEKSKAQGIKLISNFLESK